MDQRRQSSVAANGQSQTGLPLRHIFLLLCAVIGVFIFVDALFFAQGASLKREGGGLETVSAVLYVCAVAVFFKSVPRSFQAPLWQVPALMTFFALRELDFDKRFTPSGVLSSNLYLDANALGTKLIAGCVILLFFLVIYRMLRHGAPSLLRGLRARESWAFFVLAAFLLTFVAKSVDGLGRKLGGIGINVPERVDAIASVFEEVGEAFIPVLAILALVAYWKSYAYHGETG
ncbi:MAG: hypothetical protein AB8B62_13570 [Roseobacter sp.]